MGQVSPAAKSCSPGILVNICPDQTFIFQRNQSQRSTRVPPALWPSPVRSSSASTWNSIIPVRVSQEHLQENTSKQRNPAQRIRISSSNKLVLTAGKIKLKVRRSKKGPNLCLKGSVRGESQDPFSNLPKNE